MSVRHRCGALYGSGNERDMIGMGFQSLDGSNICSYSLAASRDLEMIPQYIRKMQNFAYNVALIHIKTEEGY